MSVTVFSKNNCSQCEATKDLMKELNIAFDEINISEKPEYVPQLKNLGFRAAPVVVTPDGAWSGFDEAKVRALAS